jgi:tight adherence protein B
LTRRGAVAALAAGIALLSILVPAATAGSGFDLRRIDTSGYPVVHLVVRSPSPDAVPPVYENGHRLRGLDFQNLGRQKAIVLAIDRSQSMQGAPLKGAGVAAERFLNRKRQSDRVSVVSFGSKALAQTPFGQATIDADTALRTLSVDSEAGTALYDAVVLGASELGAQTLPGRVLVLLTDGRNVRSLANFDDALRAAKQANIVVYAIALGDADRFPLKRLARATGGSFYASPTAAALEAIYRKIGSELDQTWQVSYSTTARPGDDLSIAVGGPAGARKSVVIPGRASRPQSSLLPGVLLRGAGGLLLLALGVGALLYLAVGRARAIPRAERIRRRVRAHTDPKGAVQKPKRRPTLATLVASIDRRFRGLHRWDRIERLVESAALPISASTLLVLTGAFAVVLSFFAAVLGASSVVIIFFFLLGLIAPLLLIRMLGRRRVRTFDDQLPDVLATIASSLRVGHGLKSALQAIADEGAPPASVELRRVLAEARLGRPLEEALVAMCERLGSEDLVYVATAVDVQTQVGGSLAGAFTIAADTVRQRQQHRRKVRALTASGRATATVLAMLPFALVVLVSLVNPHYMLPFLRSGLGHLLLIYAIVSISLGFILLKRIADVEA